MMSYKLSQTHDTNAADERVTLFSNQWKDPPSVGDFETDCRFWEAVDTFDTSGLTSRNMLELETHLYASSMLCPLSRYGLIRCMQASTGLLLSDLCLGIDGTFTPSRDDNAQMKANGVWQRVLEQEKKTFKEKDGCRYWNGDDGVGENLNRNWIDHATRMATSSLLELDAYYGIGEETEATKTEWGSRVLEYMLEQIEWNDHNHNAEDGHDWEDVAKKWPAASLRRISSRVP